MTKIRLQVFLSRNGLCSRREAMSIVQSGSVIVNGKVVFEPSFQVDPERDQVRYRGKLVGPKPFEYVMLHQVNDQLSHAKGLRKWLDGISAKVNLIPYNHYVGGRYQCSSAEAIAAFQSCLVEAGIHTTVRQTRGDDVTAACGQLKGAFQDRTLRTAAGRAWVMQHQSKRQQTRQAQ